MRKTRKSKTLHPEIEKAIPSELKKGILAKLPARERKRLLASFAKERRLVYLIRRVNKLSQKHLDIEALLLSGQIIEHLIGNIVERCEEVIELSIDRDSAIKVPELRQEKETLGNLIRILERCVDDEDLIKRLKEFAYLRNKAVHCLLNVSEVFQKIEEDISAYIKAESLHDLIIELQRLDMRIGCERIALTMIARTPEKDKEKRKVRKAAADLYKKSIKWVEEGISK